MHHTAHLGARVLGTARSGGRGACGPYPPDRPWLYETARGGVFGGGGVGHERHLRAEGARHAGDGLHLGVARVGSDIPDVYGGYAARVLAHDLEVDLRVLLSRVADEDEREIRVSEQESADDTQLVGPVLAEHGGAPVLQQQRTRGNTVHVQEVLQDVVDVPRAAGDVEDGVVSAALGAAPQRLVEGVHALEG